ncbi:hypothetical protein RUND412_003036 [Rhizina undulata]
MATIPSTCPGPVAFEKILRFCFYLYKELVAQISQELHAHVYNDMKEGNKGVMDLEDVSPDIMTRFCQWAYTGDYYDVSPHNEEPMNTSNTQFSSNFPNPTI